MRKNRVLVITVKVAIIIILIVGFVLYNEVINDNNKKLFVPIEDSNKYAYQIEDVKIDNEYLVIKGWYFELLKVRNNDRKLTETQKTSIILYDINSSDSGVDSDGTRKKRTGLNADMEYVIRNDVNNYFKCEYDYSKCGFIARIDKENLDLLNGHYQIVIKSNEGSKEGIMTNEYLVDGKLIHINPKDRVGLNVVGTDLQPIVDEGTCLVSNPQYHIYLYQYEGKFYWIAEKGFDFEKDGGTFIELLIETTQFDKLPQERIDRGDYWGSEGFYFEKNEITDQFNCGEYRVQVMDVPREYSVTLMKTGYYLKNKWIWNNSFRPIYEFD